MISNDDPERVISFWIQLDENAQYGGGGEIDSRIEDEFSGLLGEAVQGQLDRWADTPRGALASTSHLALVNSDSERREEPPASATSTAALRASFPIVTSK